VPAQFSAHGQDDRIGPEEGAVTWGRKKGGHVGPPLRCRYHGVDPVPESGAIHRRGEKFFAPTHGITKIFRQHRPRRNARRGRPMCLPNFRRTARMTA